MEFEGYNINDGQTALECDPPHAYYGTQSEKEGLVMKFAHSTRAPYVHMHDITADLHGAVHPTQLQLSPFYLLSNPVNVIRVIFLTRTYSPLAMY